MTNLVWVGVCLVTFFVGFTGGVIAMALASITKEPTTATEYDDGCTCDYCDRIRHTPRLVTWIKR